MRIREGGRNRKEIKRRVERCKVTIRVEGRIVKEQQ
jgi:hypothetical protein